MADLLTRINADYDRILFALDDPPGAVKQEVDELNRKLRERRALAGPRVLPTFIKPFFITQQHVDYWRRTVNTLLQCQEKLINLYFESESFRHLYELQEREISLVAIPHRLQRHIHFSRMDSIPTGSGIEDFQFLEFNCDSPGGAYYADIQRELLAEMKVMKALAGKYSFDLAPYRPRVLKTLLDAWKYAGCSGKPNIAVMGNPEVTNVEEFRLFADYFTANGYDAVFTDPWSLNYDGKELTKDGFRIDLVYRRGILKDYSGHVEESKAAVDAYRDGNVLFLNPFSAKLGDNKNLLSVLTDPPREDLFTPAEQEMIRKHIPWTRIVREGTTRFEGRDVDLMEFVRRSKDRFVIKPNSEYGGKGVVIGHETSQPEWDAALEEGLTQPRVVQAYVPIPVMQCPVFDPDLRLADKKFNTNFFTFSGEYGGGFCRTSDSSVINISAGGALVTFWVLA